MNRFVRRFIQINAPLISRTLREIAHQVDLIAPGSPVLGIVLFKGEKVMGAITVPDNSDPLSATVSFVDAEGNPTTADDVPQWSSSDESVATVEPSEDGLSASIPIGAPGATVIMVETTNDDGSTAAATGTITVEPGDAVFGSVEFTAPA